MPRTFLVRVSRRVPYRTPWMRVEEHKLRLRQSGKQITYSFVASARSVQVLAVTPRKKILVVRQYRYPTRGWNYEFPGGSAGRAPLERAARRELEQETGWRAGKLTKLGDFVVCSGLSSEISHVFLAGDLRPGRQNLDETEHLSVAEVGWRELLGMIRRGTFRDGMGLAALGIAREKLRRALC